MLLSDLRGILLNPNTMQNTLSIQNQADRECCEHQEEESHGTIDFFDATLTQNQADEIDLNNSHELSTSGNLLDNSTIEYPSLFLNPALLEQQVTPTYISYPSLSFMEPDVSLSHNHTAQHTVSKFRCISPVKLMLGVTVAVCIAVFSIITTVALIPGVSAQVIAKVVVGTISAAILYFIIMVFIIRARYI